MAPQELVNPSKYDGVVLEEDGFEFFYPNKPIKCQIMGKCKLKSSCIDAHRRKGVSLPTTPSNDEELYLEEEYSPSNDLERFVADLPLVGLGEPKPLCGNFYKVGCLEYHNPIELDPEVVHQQDLDGNCLKNGVFGKVHRFYCHRPMCPVCQEEWRGRATKRCLERFKVYDEDERNLRAGRQIHFIMSVPKRIWHKTASELRLIAMKEAKKVGFEGGSCIYHSKRKNAKKGLYFSPHFHFLGYGWILSEESECWEEYIDSKGRKRKKRIGWTVAERHAKTGWIFKNTGLRKSLEGTIRYELSHAAVPTKSGHVVTWFGSMGYSNLQVEKVKGEKERCPWGHELQDIAYVGKDALLIPKEDGYSFYFPSEGWVYLAKWKQDSGG